MIITFVENITVYLHKLDQVSAYECMCVYVCATYDDDIV